MLTIELNDPLEHISHRVGTNFRCTRQACSPHVQPRLGYRFSDWSDIHCMMLSQAGFDRNSEGMVSMVLNRLVNRILANISSDNDPLMVRLVGM